jgi:hypothetical protein
VLNDLDVPPATTAVLHGMMATLSEVLGGIDARMAAIEQQLRETRADTGSPRALAQTVDAAVARLAERIEALEAITVRPPARDDALHAAVDSLRQSVDALAVRPVRDDALHDAIAALAARPAPAPTYDEALRAVVFEMAARPPAVDTELRAAVAELVARPTPAAPAPTYDEELRAAVAELVARPAPAPTYDEELRAAVARLTEIVSRPPPAPDPEDPVRLGITSLHERLSVLLELASQPAKPDDGVRAGLVALQEAVEALRDPSPDPAINDLGERLRRLEEATVAAAAADEEASNAMRLTLARLGEIATTIENQPAPEFPAFPAFPEIPPFPDLEPVIGLRGAIERMEQQVTAFVAQPGPGPAMAMVAAGLAERFESRTDALVDLLASAANRLDAVATAPHDMAARVEGFVGRQFAELPALLAHLRGDEVLDRIRVVVESQQGDVVAMRDAMRSLFDSVERHGAVSSQVAELLLENRAALGREVDRLHDVVNGQSSDLGERVQAALEAAARADAHAAEMGAAVSDHINAAAARLVADVQAMVATGQDPARLDAVADRISESVRKESELLTQRVASLSVAVDNLRSTIDAVADDMSNSIGRKATEVGRRLAADLGIKPKKAGEKKDRSLGPGGRD